MNHVSLSLYRTLIPVNVIKGSPHEAIAQGTLDHPRREITTLSSICLTTPSSSSRNDYYSEFTAGYSAAFLDLLDDGDKLVEEGLSLLDAVDLGDDVLSGVFLEDLGQLRRLFVALDVLEAVGLLDCAEESVDLLTFLSQLSGGADEAFLAREFPERSAADTLDIVLEDGVGDTLDDLLDVFILLLCLDAVLGDNQVGSLLDSVTDDIVELLVLENLVDEFNLVLVSVVGGSGVGGVDGEELALDVRLEVVDVVNALDIRLLAAVLEWLLLNTPLVEFLDDNVQASVGRLLWDNAVDS